MKKQKQVRGVALSLACMMAAGSISLATPVQAAEIVPEEVVSAEEVTVETVLPEEVPVVMEDVEPESVEAAVVEAAEPVAVTVTEADVIPETDEIVSKDVSYDNSANPYIIEKNASELKTLDPGAAYNIPGTTDKLILNMDQDLTLQRIGQEDELGETKIDIEIRGSHTLTLKRTIKNTGEHWQIKATNLTIKEGAKVNVIMQAEGVGGHSGNDVKEMCAVNIENTLTVDGGTLTVDCSSKSTDAYGIAQMHIGGVYSYLYPLEKVVVKNGGIIDVKTSSAKSEKWVEVIGVIAKSIDVNRGTLNAAAEMSEPGEENYFNDVVGISSSSYVSDSSSPNQSEKADLIINNQNGTITASGKRTETGETAFVHSGSCGIYSTGNLIVNGNGIINATGEDTNQGGSAGIFFWGDMTVNGGKLNATAIGKKGKVYGIASYFNYGSDDNGSVIINNGEIHVKCAADDDFHSLGIQCNMFTLHKGRVTIESGVEHYYAIDYSDLIINGGELSTSGSIRGDYNWSDPFNGVTTATVNGGTVNGSLEATNITINGGKINGSAEASKALLMKGGSVVPDSSSERLSGIEKTEINGGNVSVDYLGDNYEQSTTVIRNGTVKADHAFGNTTVAGGDVAIRSYGDNLTVTGGKLSVSNWALTVGGNLSVSGGQFDVKSGAHIKGNMSMSGGTMNVTDAATSTDRIHALRCDGDILITGGNLTVTGYAAKTNDTNNSVVRSAIAAGGKLTIGGKARIITPQNGTVKSYSFAADTNSSGSKYDSVKTVTRQTIMAAGKTVPELSVVIGTGSSGNAGTGNGTGTSDDASLPDTKGAAKADGATNAVAGARAEQAGSWKGNAKKGYWYSYQDGNYPKSTIAVIGGAYYYFDKSGYMKTGWQKVGGKYYYFAGNGKMQIGWVKSGKKWYYMNPGTGVMMTGWVKIGGKWYLFNKSGAMQTGWKKSGKKWYYMNKSGVMQTGWEKVSGKWYYLDKKSGAMKTGWLKDGGKWYYLDSKGVMVTNTTRTIKGKKYTFNKSGVWVK